MATAQLSGNKRFDTQISVQTATKKTNVSFALEFQNHLKSKSRKHGIIDNTKHKKSHVNKSVKEGSIMCNIIKMLSISTGRFIVPQTSFLHFSFLGHKT